MLFATTHSLRELSALSRTRAGGYDLPAEDLAEAERIVGGGGADATTRLGLPERADDADVRDRAEALLARWRRIAESPLTERTVVDLCQIVIRSLEQIASSVGVGASRAAADDVPLAR